MVTTNQPTCRNFFDTFRAWYLPPALTSVCFSPSSPLLLLLLLLFVAAVGCYAEGDYNVIVPSDTAAGMYKIRVGLFGDQSVFACSDSFEVMPPGTNFWVENTQP